MTQINKCNVWRLPDEKIRISASVEFPEIKFFLDLIKILVLFFSALRFFSIWVVGFTCEAVKVTCYTSRTALNCMYNIYSYIISQMDFFITDWLIEFRAVVSKIEDRQYIVKHFLCSIFGLFQLL